ncbi:PD40 domain-containing protein [bacterium]|nr:PD40 domain-containing protein [bacterium]
MRFFILFLFLTPLFAQEEIGIQPINISSVNSGWADFAPYITADGRFLYFASSRGGNEDFYCSRRVGNEWEAPENIGPPVNSEYNEGSLCITPDGSMIIFSSCGRPDSHGGCDLYFSRMTKDGWSEPENLGPSVNTFAWEGHPSISADGKTLYFASNRLGGYGGFDIYCSDRLPDGSWSKARNVGYPVNTARDELSPFIHTDGQTLYFSSAGHRGLGLLDIYRTVKGEDGRFSPPENLGPPVNTQSNDYFFSIPASGDYIYFSSARKGGFGDSDIYFMLLEEALKPRVVATVSGKVMDSRTKEPVSASIRIENLTDAVFVGSFRTNPSTGGYYVVLPAGKLYGITVESPGYAFFSMHFEPSVDEGYKEFNIPVLLKPVEVGEVLQINNIFFNFNSDSILPESESELLRAVKLLNDYPDVGVEILGYADSIGTEAYNLELSHRRAEAVKNYLVEHGIDASRLVAKGMGERPPATGEPLALQRKTEFRIVANKK